MYRIMVLAEETANNSSTYRFFKIKTSKGYKIYETDDKTELEQQVEDMLNGDYRKKDLLVVNMIDYSIETDIDDANEDTPVDNGSTPEPTNPNSSVLPIGGSDNDSGD